MDSEVKDEHACCRQPPFPTVGMARSAVEQIRAKVPGRIPCPPFDGLLPADEVCGGSGHLLRASSSTCALNN
jgi:hypothetical protein